MLSESLYKSLKGLKRNESIDSNLIESKNRNKFIKFDEEKNANMKNKILAKFNESIYLNNRRRLQKNRSMNDIEKDEKIPGLAMSRSFGDETAHMVGVIAEPEILDYYFLHEDKFIMIASDGIWEFISSDECVKIVKDYYLKNDLEGALNSGKSEKKGCC